MTATTKTASSAGDCMARAALYSPGQRGVPGSGLLPASREARRLGLRVVVIAQDDPDDAQGLGGQRLLDLVRRMNRGEFEAIVADAASDGLLILQITQLSKGVSQ